jgi:hypothetical protein
MIITKMALPRRTFLRGVGASLALPLLDAMVPALSAMAKTAASPVRRLGVVYVPNGMAMEYWTPAGAGPEFGLTPVLQPLAPFRDRLLIVSGLNGPAGGGTHTGASTRFLTGVRAETDGSAGISIDQLVAKELGQHTQLSSLELALDGRDNSGTCEGRYICAFTNTISWRSRTTPLPMENNPRAVFERLFGDSGSTDPKHRLERLRRTRSILDSLTETVADLQGRVGPSDGRKIQEYLDAVRDLERRIQKAEQQSGNELAPVERPAGVPATLEEHAKLMFDLQVLAYQCDLTRVITFMIGREFSGRTYPEIGVPEAHHPLSHHQNDTVKIASLAKVNTYHTTLLAYYLEKLNATADGEGSLLDHLTLMYGAGMSDSNAHDYHNLPVLLAGGGSGHLKGGRHLKYVEGTWSNLLLTVAEKAGVRLDRIGDSTGRLDIETLAGI